MHIPSQAHRPAIGPALVRTIERRSTLALSNIDEVTVIVVVRSSQKETHLTVDGGIARRCGTLCILVSESDIGCRLVDEAFSTMLISLILGFRNKVARIAKHMMLAKGVVVIDIEVATELRLLTILHHIETTAVPQ